MIADALKKALLQAAIQGKLTEQLPEDGDARDLLKAIQKEKARLIKEGNIKKQKTLPEITEDEIPFYIPRNWVWVRLGEFSKIINGFTPLRSKSNFWDSQDIPWFTVKDIRDQGHFIDHTQEYISSAAINGSERIVKANSVLLCCTASIGEFAYTKIDLTTNQQFNGITIDSLFEPFITPLYIYYYVQTITERLISEAGKTTFHFLSTRKLANFTVPIAPLSEQQRIVKKIEEILPEIEVLKVEENKLDNLEKAFAGKIRASILQAAIQGKLTEQLPEDGDARDLLKEIQKEKDRLIKEGKIKREKPLPEVTEDEIPFDIPDNWVWVRLGELGDYRKGPFGSSLTKSMFIPDISNAIKVYEQKNAIQKNEKLGEYFIDQVYYLKKMRGFTVEGGDIIISCAGTIGESYILPNTSRKGIINQALMRVRTFTGIEKKYYLHAFNYTLDAVGSKGKGSAIKNIPPFKILKELLIPLPPLIEQQRIIEKLNELLPLCDALE